MKRWKTAWTATAIAGLFALPVTARGQAPAGSLPPSAPQNKTAGMPQDHLEKADAAVKSISSGAVSSKAAARIAELKQHLNALQTVAATQAGPSAAASTNAHAGHGGPTGAQWSTQAAAADKIIGELLNDAPAGAIGPSTAADTKPSSGAGGAATATTAVSLDDDTRAKLTTARASLMAFAAAMGGAESGTKGPAQPPAAPPKASETSSAGPAATAATTNAAAQASAASPSAETPSAAASPAPAASAPTGQNTTPAQGAGAPRPAAAGSSFETAKQALTAARDSLSQLTKLPAVQQLTGEPRTQISQLITSFNALITATTDWRGAYAKVDAHLTALAGPPTAEQPADATSVGTSGGGAADGLDPVLKAKLAEFRTHLKEFEKAASAAPGKE